MIKKVIKRSAFQQEQFRIKETGYGKKQKTQNDTARFFNISEEPLDEVRYFLILSKDLGLSEEVQSSFDLSDEVAKLLYSSKKTTLNSSE